MKATKYSCFCFIMFVLTLLFQCFVAMSPSITFRVFQKLLIVLLGLLWLTLALHYQLKDVEEGKEKKKIIRWYLWIVFMIYICNLTYLLFFDEDFGRTFTIQNNNIMMNMVDGINLEPFKMIKDYLLAYQNHNIYFVHLLLNVVGNLIVFSPMGIFLPTLFKTLDSYIRFPLFMAIMIILSEFAQVYFSVGVGDIDDFILNFTGAMLMFFIYKLPFIKRRWYALIKDDGGKEDGR